MKPRRLIGAARVPGGGELRLFERGGEFTIALGGNELMSSRASGSEEALATMTAERMGTRPSPRLLIGGYGMGFTLRAALAGLGTSARIVVAEIVPEVVAWAQGPMAEMTGGCLDDDRVTLRHEDVADTIGAASGGYDAILLDVDNGPDGLSRRGNDRLYSATGLATARRALAEGGILAVWSAGPSASFNRRLRDAGFDIEEIPIRARGGGRGARHVIWFATKR